jgi:hypothetical protein
VEVVVVEGIMQVEVVIREVHLLILPVGERVVVELVVQEGGTLMVSQVRSI